MKKNVATVLVSGVFITLSILVYVLLTENKHATETINLYKELYEEKEKNLNLQNQITEISESKDALDDLYSSINNDYIELQKNYRLLNDSVLGMHSDSEKDKLLKERLPYGMTNTLRFMDYLDITDRNTLQYKLQEECDTDVDSGIRVYYVKETKTNYYCVALGSAYGCQIGDTWKVTLGCGTTFNIILAENKDYGLKEESFGDEDANYDGEPCINIIEFIVDFDYIPLAAKKTGTYTVFDELGGLNGKGGNVAKMEYTGNIWKE